MAASKAPLELLQGAARLEESFNIEPTTTGSPRGAGGIPLITLTSKGKEHEATQNLQKIVVEVFPKTYFIRTVSLYEVSGNVAVFEFANLKPNVGLGNEVFDFKTPPDAEVVRAPVLNGP
jgi:outer membrane lipoprotein carrier protein